jgi:Protein of unknown function (DUF1449)
MTMTTQWLLGWWNLIFILPFGLGLLYLGLYTVSGWTFGEGDLDHDLDTDVDAHLDVDSDVSVEHDIDTDAHVALEHDVDADADTDADAHADGHDAQGSGSHGSTLLTLLSWLGIGRVPLSMVLMILVMTWGVIGFCANQATFGWSLDRSVPVSIAIAGIGSLLITRVVTMLVARYLPTNETYARRRHELLGSTGEAMYPIDSTFGMVYGRDDRGESFQVACRIEANQPVIAKGTAVQLVGYNAKEQLFFVVPANESSGSGNPGLQRTV